VVHVDVQVQHTLVVPALTQHHKNQLMNYNDKHGVGDAGHFWLTTLLAHYSLEQLQDGQNNVIYVAET
jgi:hypothetical protein